MNILFFGTYDVRRHPRVRVLQEGFTAHGDRVLECNVPLGLETAWRVRILQRPWLLPLLLTRMAMAWARLARRARRLPGVDAVVVGYLGHFDVHLARRLWRRTTIALDHLISARDTAEDRGSSSNWVERILGQLDEAALRAADVVCIDTREHRETLPAWARPRAVIIPVGAPARWFRRPQPRADDTLAVAFFGLFTPLQGAPVVGKAIALLREEAIRFTMIGRGQDFAAARAAAAANPNVEWRDWVDGDELPDLVAAHDVCLGIFGTSPKARRVVPNKVFQGAAAGTAIVTSATPPQQRAFEEAAVFVNPGDSGALADALAALARDRERVETLRVAAYARAAALFRPETVVEPLRERLITKT